jgi:hypothetical protein
MDSTSKVVNSVKDIFVLFTTCIAPFKVLRVTSEQDSPLLQFALSRGLRDSDECTAVKETKSGKKEEVQECPVSTDSVSAVYRGPKKN